MQVDIQKPDSITEKVANYTLTISIDRRDHDEPKLNIILIDRTNQNRYEGSYSFSNLEKFHINYQSIEDIYGQLYESLSKKDQYLKIEDNGVLKVGYTTTRNKTLKYLDLVTELKQVNQMSKVHQAIQLISLDVKQVQKIVQQMRCQILVQLRKEIQIQTQSRKKADQQIKERITQTNQYLMENHRTQIEKIRQQMNSKGNKDEIKAIFQQIQKHSKQEIITLRRQYSQALDAVNREIQQNITRLATNHQQMKRVQQSTVSQLQTKIVNQSQKSKQHIIAFQCKLTMKPICLLKHNQQKITADPTLPYYKKYKTVLGEENYLQGTGYDSQWYQIVSKQTLSKTGKYYFSIGFKNFKSSFAVGILTQACRGYQCSYNNKQAICYYDTNIIHQGKTTPGGRAFNFDEDRFMHVLVNRDKNQISWYIDCEFQFRKEIPQSMNGKNLYAFIDRYLHPGELSFFVS